MNSELEKGLCLECRLNNRCFYSEANKINWNVGGKRGGFDYIPPLGWIGIGLNVSKKYDNGNDDWLAHDGNKNEWAVAYHSVDGKVLSMIIFSGFRAGGRQIYKDNEDIYHPGQKVGAGVYFTPDPKIMDNFNNKVININGKKYKCALMVRVKPDKIRCPSENKNFWILNAISDEIRPYRILLKEI